MVSGRPVQRAGWSPAPPLA